MRFLIDAHLPPTLRAVFAEFGHDAIHTIDLPGQNAARDGDLNAVSVRDERIVVTKDTDFYFSHLVQGRPWKLVLVRTGNMRTRDVKALFRALLPEIARALETHSLVEIDRQQVVFAA